MNYDIDVSAKVSPNLDFVNEIPTLDVKRA